MQIRSGPYDPRSFDHAVVLLVAVREEGEFVGEEVDEVVLGDTVDDCFSSRRRLSSELNDPRLLVPDCSIEPDEVDSRRGDAVCELLDGSEGFQLEWDPFDVVAMIVIGQ